MLGATNPMASTPGSIRGDYCVTMGRKICHGSDGPDSAAHEIGMFACHDKAVLPLLADALLCRLSSYLLDVHVQACCVSES